MQRKARLHTSAFISAHEGMEEIKEGTNSVESHKPHVLEYMHCQQRVRIQWGTAETTENQ